MEHFDATCIPVTVHALEISKGTTNQQQNEYTHTYRKLLHADPLLVMSYPSLLSSQNCECHIIGQGPHHFRKLLSCHIVTLNVVDRNNVVGALEACLGKNTVFVDRLDT